jgi:hypothetical protein
LHRKSYNLQAFKKKFKKVAWSQCFSPPGYQTAIVLNKTPNPQTGIRGGSCNPSYWEVGILGWFGVG